MRELDRGEYDALILAAGRLKAAGGLNIGSAGIFLQKRSFRRPDRGFWLSRDEPERIMDFWRLWQRKGPGRKLWQREHLSGNLDGGCSSPVAAYARVEKGRLYLRGLYYIEEKGSYTLGSREGRSEDAEEIGVLLAEEMERKYGRKGGAGA